MAIPGKNPAPSTDSPNPKKSFSIFAVYFAEEFTIENMVTKSSQNNCRSNPSGM